MKLLFALLVVSALTLKVEGAAVANDGDCSAADATCSDTNAECKSDPVGGKTCLCKDNYDYDADTACKLVAGQACTEATKANCLTGTCTDKFCGGSKDNDAACSSNTDCMSLNCKFMEGTDKCAESASATVVASLTLMLVTLVTTRFL